MTPRCLFGPVTRAYAEECLQPFRSSGQCLAFGTEAGLDLTIGLDDAWGAIAARMPAGWSPSMSSFA